MKGYIYRLLFEDNTDYIGRTIDLKRRLRNHSILEKKGIAYEVEILLEISENNRESLEIELNKAEESFIKLYNPSINKYRCDTNIRICKHSKETRQKMSMSHTGSNHSVESKKKRAGVNAYQAKAVYSKILDKEFPTIRDAAKYLNLSSSCKISQVIRGERKSAGKHPVTNQSIDDWIFVNKAIPSQALKEEKV